jgi:hypothetical protein
MLEGLHGRETYARWPLELMQLPQQRAQNASLVDVGSPARDEAPKRDRMPIHLEGLSIAGAAVCLRGWEVLGGKPAGDCDFFGGVVPMPQIASNTDDHWCRSQLVEHVLAEAQQGRACRIQADCQARSIQYGVDRLGQEGRGG